MAFRTLLGESNMMAYLAMMAPRLVELRRVLKPTGSIYLHCDPTASHYLKMLMDAVFGAGELPQRDRLEADARRSSNAHGAARRRARQLLFYSKGEDAHVESAHVPLRPRRTSTTHYRHWTRTAGVTRLDNCTEPGLRPADSCEPWREATTRARDGMG